MSLHEGTQAEVGFEPNRRPKLRTTLVRHLGTPDLTLPASHKELDPEDGFEARDRSDLPTTGDVIDEHYRLVRLLGEGMFGRVFEAERTDVSQHRVALKLLERAVYGGRDVERELVMLAAATHPHIVQLQDHGVTPRYVWLTMPLYEGETLEECLTGGPLKLRDAYDIFLPVARGLQELHARGLRHQDIKPENIFLAHFVDDRVHPILLDLGVAVEATSDFVAGTMLYAAPEQIEALSGLGSPGALSDKIDTYCFASTLLRVLVGPKFFPGETAQTPLQLVQAREEREVKPIRDGAMIYLQGEPRRKLNEALGRWMTRDADARPTIKELADQLDVLLEEEREAARAETLAQARQKASLQRGRIAVAMLLLAGAGVAAWGYSKRETLRLAGELEQARAEGERGFADFNTCKAAYAVSDRESRLCSEAREEDKKRHASAIAALSEGAEGNEEGLITKLTEANGLLWAAQDELKSKQAEWDQAKKDMESSLASKEEAWASERTELQSKIDGLNESNEQLTSDKQMCDSSLATVTQERDSCRADPYDPTQPKPVPQPNPGPSTAPPPPPPPPPPAPPPEPPGPAPVDPDP